MSRQVSPLTFVSALSIILLLGIGATFAFKQFLANSLPETLWALGQTVTAPTASFAFTLNTPDDDSLVYDKGLVVSGKTQAYAAVVISTDDDQDTGLQADKEGNFSQVITLSPGLTHLEVSAFDKDGNTKKFYRTVYYSTQKL